MRNHFCVSKIMTSGTSKNVKLSRMLSTLFIPILYWIRVSRMIQRQGGAITPCPVINHKCWSPTRYSGNVCWFIKLSVNFLRPSILNSNFLFRQIFDQVHLVFNGFRDTLTIKVNVFSPPSILKFQLNAVTHTGHWIFNSMFNSR